MAVTRIQNNQITDSTILAYTKINPGSITGNLFANNVTLNSNLSIVGNLSISGNTTTVNSTDTYINDPLVVFNNGYSGSLSGYDIGVLVNRNLTALAGYGSVNTAWIWVENDQAFEAITTTATGSYGSSLQNINNSGFANVKIGNLFAQSGTVYATNIYASTIGNASTTLNGTLSATNISGTVATANVANYVTTTATGTNASYDVAFLSSTSGNLAVDANSSLTYNPSTGLLAATTFSGSGASLTNLVGSQVTGTVATANAAVYTGVTNTSSGTYYPILGGQSTTGNTQSAVSSGLSYNAATGTLTATYFSGAIAGGVAFANVSSYEQVTPLTTNQTFYPMFSNTSVAGNTAAGVATNLSFNPGTGNLTVGSIALTGNAISSLGGTLLNLGSPSTVTLSGGANGYALTTNGQGTLNFSAANVIVLGANASGQLVSNAVTLTTTTDVTDAIAQLNAILGKLTPAAPPNFPNGSLSVSGTTQYSGYMTAFTQTDNSGWGNLSVAGGTLISNSTRVTTLSTSVIGVNGTTPSGGNVQLYVNGAVAPSSYHVYGTSASTADNGTYGNLVLSLSEDYHTYLSTVSAGFWYIFAAAGSLTSVQPGWNRANIYYTGDATGTNTLTWYYDSSSPSTPAFTSTSIALSSNTVSYSSTIPHLNSSAGFTLTGSVANLSGDLYYSNWSSTASSLFSTTGAGGALLAPANRTLAQAGIPLPLTRNNTSAYSFSTTSNVTTGFGSSASTSGPTVSVNNNYSTGTVTFQQGAIILYKTGTTTQIEETSLTNAYSGSPSTYRIVNPDGGTAADNPVYTGTESAFNSSTSTLLATDATVVAAKLQYDVTNYSTGYYPVGPNLSSGRSASQYFTFKFAQAAIATFNIAYTGTIAGLWIALPGVTDPTYASTTNGWLNAAAAYAGSGVPGTGSGGNGSTGCAVGGTATLNSNTTANVTVTFGSVNSSTAGNKSNEIYVRVKLTSGQSLTALSIQP